MNKILILITFLINSSIVLAIETSIIFKIGNDIITNQDIKNEYQYLTILNKSLIEMPKDKVFEIAKSSIIKEKIKNIEIENYFEKKEIDKDIKNKLFKNLYKRIGIVSEKEFIIRLNSTGLNKSDLLEKITIEYLWNQLILIKYSSMVTIDPKKLKKKLLEKKSKITASFLLSEIVYEVKSKKDIDNKTKEIIKNIKEFGFENSAIKYSISATANTGGKLDWINEKVINEKILNEIKQLGKGQITNPIILPNGFLLLKVNDIKKEEDKFNIDEQLNKVITMERNRQLNQFSKIYFNKVKRNLEFDG